MSSTPTTPDIDPSQGASAPSVLSQTIAPQQAQYDPSDEQQMDAATSGPQASPPGGGRLVAVLGAISKTLSTGLAGVPAGNRPSFIGGIGQGARANQAADAVAQDLKFKTMDDSLRAASLHNQDLEAQGRVQAQQDAHEDHMDAMDAHAAANDWGVTHNTVANNGAAVTQYLQTQTAVNGAATVPPGTHISADGETIKIPQDTPSNNTAMLREYNALGPVFNLPPSPAGATKLPPSAATVYYNLKQGYGPDGNVITADKLPGIISSNQTKLDDLNKTGGTDAQKTLVQGIITKQQAQLKADNDQQQASAQGKKQGEVNAENSSTAVQGAGAKAGAVSNAEQANKLALQQNAQDVKPVKPVSDEWKPGVTASQKNKTDLAENMAANINSVNSILAKRPDLVGAVAGRFTTTEQMIGNNDPDIAALGTAIHNIGMANNGIYGMKANEGVKDFEALTLNHFKNGPQAIGGALNESAKSVQTFIDAARPDTYKTSSAQGGALKAMGGSGQTQNQQFTHLSASGKFGWNGTQWVSVNGGQQ